MDTPRKPIEGRTEAFREIGKQPQAKPERPYGASYALDWFLRMRVSCFGMDTPRKLVQPVYGVFTGTTCDVRDELESSVYGFLIRLVCHRGSSPVASTSTTK